MTAVFAHRGCTDGFVENTLDAFAEARRLGADGVELDVRLTADGGLAVHHDAEIPGLGAIAALGVADLPAHVPLLADVLAVCDGHGGQRRDQERPPGPGWDPGEAVAALTAAAIEEAGWTDRVHRLVVPGRPRCWRCRPPTAAWPSARSGGSPSSRSRRWPRRSSPGSRAVHPFVSCRGCRAGRAGACRGPRRQRVDRQRPRGPAGHGGAGRGRGDHRPAGRRPGHRRRRARADDRGRKRARHRAEWRGTARVHKDGRP